MPRPRSRGQEGGRWAPGPLKTGRRCALQNLLVARTSLCSPWPQGLHPLTGHPGVADVDATGRQPSPSAASPSSSVGASGPQRQAGRCQRQQGVPAPEGAHPAGVLRSPGVRELRASQNPGPSAPRWRRAREWRPRSGGPDPAVAACPGSPAGATCARIVPRPGRGLRLPPSATRRREEVPRGPRRRPLRVAWAALPLLRSRPELPPGADASGPSSACGGVHALRTALHSLATFT